MNSTTSVPEGFVSRLATGNALVLGGTVLVLYLIGQLLTPRMGADEPPLDKPTIPLIGHIIGIIRYQNTYHRMLHKQRSVPATSLQMLWGKMYAVWDPALANATFRSRDASMEPFVDLFVRKGFQLTPKAIRIMEESPGLAMRFSDAIHASMNSTAVQRMNVNAMNYIAKTVNTIDAATGMETENLYLWIRGLITLATTYTLYGQHNVFDQDKSLIDDLWDTEEVIPDLLTRPWPSVTVRKGYQARNRLQAGLAKWYAAGHYLQDTNDEIANITKVRARFLKDEGFDGDDLGKAEFMLAVAGTTNSAPFLYWALNFVHAQPDLVDALRKEIEPLVSRKGDDAALDLTRLEAECPLLVGCYRETNRLTNDGISSRRLAKDVTIKDGSGREYSLKKGVDVQISIGINLTREDVWGSDAAEFRPERWLPGAASSKTEEKARKEAFIPFGGGRHLCPGRQFAITELLGLLSTLVVGFELQSTGVAFTGVKPRGGTMASNIRKPVKDGDGQGLKVQRRKGWETVSWRYNV